MKHLLFWLILTQILMMLGITAVLVEDIFLKAGCANIRIDALFVALSLITVARNIASLVNDVLGKKK